MSDTSVRKNPMLATDDEFFTHTFKSSYGISRS